MTQEVKVGTQRDVHDYLQSVPGSARSIETVAAATGIEYIKVSQALADLARNPELGIRRISKGVYRLDRMMDPAEPGPRLGDDKPVIPTMVPVLGTDQNGNLLVHLPDGSVGRVVAL